MLPVAVMLVASHFTSECAGEFYDRSWPGSGSIAAVDLTALIGVLLIPAAAFEIDVDFAHIYFPVALGLAGWVLGGVVSYGVARLGFRV